MVVDLLQQIGLNKYEAEAYATLLQHGPLTGYELGKRSGVPLSRSYEVLERLTGKGLALAQPGDPPRYAAEPPELLLARTRASTTATLDALARELAELGAAGQPEGFWVLRGREQILAHARSWIGQAQRTLALRVAPAHAAALEQALQQARARGCRVALAQPDAQDATGAHFLLLADEREGMAGTLAPTDRAQVVAGANPGFVAALSRSFVAQPLVGSVPRAAPALASTEAQPLDWLDWEQHKQRRLLDSHVA